MLDPDGTAEATASERRVHKRIARRSDGATAESFLASNPDAAGSERGLVEMRRTIMLPQSDRTIRMALPYPNYVIDAEIEATPSAVRSTQENCGVSEPEHGNYLGHDAVIATQRGPETGQPYLSEVEHWYAPDLGCIEVQWIRRTSPAYRMYVDSGGSFMAVESEDGMEAVWELVRRADDIELGEPDPELFAIPPEYQPRSVY